jgi:hypothetical protein
MESDGKRDETKFGCKHGESQFSCQTENHIGYWTGNRMWKRRWLIRRIRMVEYYLV